MPLFSEEMGLRLSWKLQAVLWKHWKLPWKLIHGGHKKQKELVIFEIMQFVRCVVSSGSEK